MLSNLNDDIKVGISDYKIARAPKQIMTVGLGSCIGTIIYDERNKIGGLSHIMLPDSSQFVGHSQIKIAKFADLALPAMVEELSKQTSTPMFRFKAKIVGGASMFSFSEDASLSVGQRNIEAVEQALHKLHIPIVAKHVGGNVGRTMIVDLNTFKTTVRMVNRKVIVI